MNLQINQFSTLDPYSVGLGIEKEYITFSQSNIFLQDSEQRNCLVVNFYFWSHLAFQMEVEMYSFAYQFLIFYVLYSCCKGMLSKEHDQIKLHFTYGAVIAPQKIFALHFLRKGYESEVISHGSFHCVQCAYQPATKFVTREFKLGKPSESFLLISFRAEFNPHLHRI